MLLYFSPFPPSRSLSHSTSSSTSRRPLTLLLFYDLIVLLPPFKCLTSFKCLTCLFLAKFSWSIITVIPLQTFWAPLPFIPLVHILWAKSQHWIKPSHPLHACTWVVERTWKKHNFVDFFHLNAGLKIINEHIIFHWYTVPVFILYLLFPHTYCPSSSFSVCLLCHYRRRT